MRRDNVSLVLPLFILISGLNVPDPTGPFKLLFLCLSAAQTEHRPAELARKSGGLFNESALCFLPVSSASGGPTVRFGSVPACVSVDRNERIS